MDDTAQNNRGTMLNRLVALLVLCLAAPIEAQVPNQKSVQSQPITASGQSVTFSDYSGSGTITMEYGFSAGLSGMSVTVQGCGQNGTCATLTPITGTNPYTSTTPTQTQFTGGYYSYKVAATYTGTGSVSVYAVGITAKITGALAGGGVNSVTGSTSGGFVTSSTGGANPSISTAVDGTHVLPVNTGTTSNCLSQAGTYVACSSGGSVPAATPVVASNGTNLIAATPSLASAAAVGALPTSTLLANTRSVYDLSSSSPNWASLSDFTFGGSGATPTVTNGGLVFSGANAGVYTAQIYKLTKAGTTGEDENSQMKMRFIYTASGSFAAVHLDKLSSSPSPLGVAVTWNVTSGMTLQTTNGTVWGTISTAAVPLTEGTPAVGDMIDLTLTIGVNSLQATAENQTQHKQTRVSVARTTQAWNGDTWAFGTLGGTFTFIDLNVRSFQPSTPQLCPMGDSKTDGFDSVGFVGRWANHLDPLGSVAVFAGGSDGAAKLLGNVPYVINAGCKTALINSLRNDLSGGVVPAPAQANYISAVNALVAAGINVVHLLPIPETVIPNQSAINTFITSTFTCGSYPTACATINPATGWVNSYMLNADGIHPTDLGHEFIASTVVNSGAIPLAAQPTSAYEAIPLFSRNPPGQFTDNVALTNVANTFTGFPNIFSTQLQTAGIVEPQVTKTAAYTVTTADFQVDINSAGGGFAVTLPAALSKQIFAAKKISTDANADSLASSALIDGQTSIPIVAPNTSVIVQGTGTSGTWNILSYTNPTGSETVASSATPVFSSGFADSYNVLTANVTSFTLAAGNPGQVKTLTFCQNATGGFTVTPPANVHGFFSGNAGAVGTTPSKCNVQSFKYDPTQTAWLGTSPGAVNQ